MNEYMIPNIFSKIQTMPREHDKWCGAVPALLTTVIEHLSYFHVRTGAISPKRPTTGGERRVETSSPMDSRCGRLGRAAIFASRRAKRPHGALRMGDSRYPKSPTIRPVLQVHLHP